MLIGQLFSIPKVLYIVGTTMILLGIVTPLNIFLFTAYGLAFVLSGRNIAEKLEIEAIERGVLRGGRGLGDTKAGKCGVFITGRLIELEFGYGIILADMNQGGSA